MIAIILFRFWILDGAGSYPAIRIVLVTRTLHCRGRFPGDCPQPSFPRRSPDTLFGRVLCPDGGCFWGSGN
jgi:hypothetical protein